MNPCFTSVFQTLPTQMHTPVQELSGSPDTFVKWKEIVKKYFNTGKYTPLYLHSPL